MLNLHATIQPSKSAAGFAIGQSYSTILPFLMGIVHWQRSLGQLSECIDSSTEWLRVNLDDISFVRTGNFDLYSPGGNVRLQFASDGILYNTTVFSGYHGSFAGSIRLGDRLDAVLGITDLFYDDGDELHYPVQESSIQGIGFLAESQPLAQSPDQVITGISVHNWNILKGQ